jgi:hypothetical protein
MSQDTQVWGTFAVDDHLRPRPFAAEVILFDHLVIPTPPAWTADALHYWPGKWQPRRLKDLMDVLGDHATPMPWDQAKREKWQGAYSQYNEQRGSERQAAAVGTAAEIEFVRNAPRDTPAKYLTRAIIENIIEEADNELVEHIRSLPLRPSTRIEPVVAYGSYSTFEEDTLHSPSGTTNNQAKPKESDALLLSWDFWVPEEPDLSDTEILAKIVTKLNNDRAFAEHRAVFNDLRRRLAAGGVDPLTAKVEIERRLVDYNRILKSTSVLQTARTVLTYAAIAAPLADVIVPFLGTGSGVAWGLASQTWSSWAIGFGCDRRNYGRDVREIFAPRRVRTIRTDFCTGGHPVSFRVGVEHGRPSASNPGSPGKGAAHASSNVETNARPRYQWIATHGEVRRFDHRYGGCA